MVTLTQIIRRQFPAAIPLVNFVVQDSKDGRSEFIAKWDDGALGPQPDEKQIAEWLANPPPPTDAELAAEAVATEYVLDQADLELLLKIAGPIEDMNADANLQAYALKLLFRDLVRRLAPAKILEKGKP